MTHILKNHFALNKGDYQQGIKDGKYNSTWRVGLSIAPITPSLAALKELQSRLSEKWQWKDQDRYKDILALDEKLRHEETAIFLLKDNGKPVGYAYVTAPDASLKERFWGAANANVIEIENLGMFPGCEGGGRGKAYFEMLFARYFKNYDTVYWSQHETHSPTLKRFYQVKMGMTLLATDKVPDFRKIA